MRGRFSTGRSWFTLNSQEGKLMGAIPEWVVVAAISSFTVIFGVYDFVQAWKKVMNPKWRD